ncbi:hypothetical protein BsWGS_16830 [Bradybaena similaris]
MYSLFTAFQPVINSTIRELLYNISSQVKVSGVDCAAIFQNSSSAILAAKRMIQTASTPLSDSLYLNITQDCDNFQKQRGYIMSSLSEEEEQFPLAYSMMVYKDSEMVERLLRAIYRPQNVYCIHVDQKAPNDFFTAISAIASCLPNVFMASRRIRVVWGKFTVLEPELVCMQDLWKYRQWKYFINLTGQEFPLRTNHELVKILTAYRGAVDAIGVLNEIKKQKRLNNTEPPPHGLRIVMGSVHSLVTRDFVDYILHNEIAKDLLNWVKTTKVPDETYFATLNANPQLGIKGTYKGEPEYIPARTSFARFKNWGLEPCAGRRVRAVCILTTGDLPLLWKSPMHFANKFYLHEDRVVIGCLEEKIFNDTRDEYTGSKIFDTSLYRKSAIVTNKVE